MEINEQIIDQAVETAQEQRESELAAQQENDRMEKNFEDAREEYEDKEKQSDYDYLVKCMNLPF